jgi:PhnB protein
MQTKLIPYLVFNGNTREAMEFYQSIFGGKLEVSTFKEFQMSPDPSMDNKIMHSALEAENGINFMASDAMAASDFNLGNNFSLSLNGDNHAELKSYFEKLSAGGTILEPLEPAPWGDTFGMLLDQFGIRWMVNISGAKA